MSFSTEIAPVTTTNETLSIVLVMNCWQAAVSHAVPGSNETANQRYDLFSWLTNGVFTVPLVFLGCVGNIYSIYLMRRFGKLRHTISLHLQTLAAWDATLLLATFGYYGLASLLVDIVQHLVLYKYIAWILHPVITITMTSSIWMVVLITSERYNAVSKPLAFRSSDTITRARIAVGAIAIGSIVFNLPTIFELHIIDCKEQNGTIGTELAPTWLRYSMEYNTIYRIVCYFIFITVCPFSVILFLTARIIYFVRKAQKECAQMVTNNNNNTSTANKRRRRNELAVTKMLLSITVKFLLCYSLPTSLNIWETSNFLNGGAPSLVFRYFVDISNFLVILNSGTNCLVYIKFHFSKKQQQTGAGGQSVGTTTVGVVTTNGKNKAATNGGGGMESSSSITLFSNLRSAAAASGAGGFRSREPSETGTGTGGDLSRDRLGSHNYFNNYLNNTSSRLSSSRAASPRSSFLGGGKLLPVNDKFSSFHHHDSAKSHFTAAEREILQKSWPKLRQSGIGRRILDALIAETPGFAVHFEQKQPGPAVTEGSGPLAANYVVGNTSPPGNKKEAGEEEEKEDDDEEDNPSQALLADAAAAAVPVPVPVVPSPLQGRQNADGGKPPALSRLLLEEESRRIEETIALVVLAAGQADLEETVASNLAAISAEAHREAHIHLNTAHWRTFRATINTSCTCAAAVPNVTSADYHFQAADSQQQKKRDGVEAAQKAALEGAWNRLACYIIAKMKQGALINSTTH